MARRVRSPVGGAGPLRPADAGGHRPRSDHRAGEDRFARDQADARTARCGHAWRGVHHKPFAALGEDASKVIDAEQFERARADAGLCFERFTARIRRDAFGYPVEIGLQVETWRGADIPDRTDVVQFDCDEDLARFIDRAQAKLDAGFQLCAWDDYEFEMTGDTQGQIDDLRSALRQRVQLRILVRYADVYDLSAYSRRIEDVGEEKPYYSPYIAKRNADESWFPENLVPVVW